MQLQMRWIGSPHVSSSAQAISSASASRVTGEAKTGGWLVRAERSSVQCIPCEQSARNLVRDAQHGAVAMTGREGHLIRAILPILEIAGSDGPIILGPGVVIPINKVFLTNPDRRWAFHPIACDGPGKWSERAGGGWADGVKNMFFDRVTAFILDEEVILVADLKKGGVDDIKPGIVKEAAFGEGLEIRGGGVIDPVIVPVIACVVCLREAPGNG